MYEASYSSRFDRDVKACKKRHWDMAALRQAMLDLLSSDGTPLAARYKDRELVGSMQGYRAIHVDSAPNPPKDRWVLLYKTSGSELIFVRTGTHEEVYGK